jgi:hypothetical protein
MAAAPKPDDWPGESLVAAPPPASDTAAPAGGQAAAPAAAPAGGFPIVAPHQAPDGSGMTNLSDADYWRFVGGQPAGTPPPRVAASPLPQIGPSDYPPLTAAPPSPQEAAWPGEQLTGATRPPPDNPWQQRGTAFIQGLASTPGMIADVRNAPANLLIGGINSLLGRDAVRPVAPSRETTGEVLQSVGLPPDYQPSWDTRVAEGVGAALGPYSLLAPFKAATRAVAASVPLGRGAFALADRPFTQAAAGAAAGYGQSVVDESKSPSLRLAVPLAAGLLAAGGVGAARNLAGAVTGTRRVLNSQVVRAMGQSAADPKAAFDRILGHTPDASDPLSGTPTTAEVAGDPGLLSMERTLRATGPTDQTTKFTQADAARQQARTGVLDAIADPGGPAAPAVANEIARQRDAAQRRLDAARGGLGPEMDPQAAGDVMQERGTAQRVPSGQNVQGLMDAVDPGGTTQIGTRGLRRAMNEAADREYYGNVDARHPEVGQMLGSLAPGPVTFQQLQRMRSVSLGKSQGLAAASDKQLAAFHRDTAEAIRQTIEQAAESGQGFTEAQRAAWNEAREAAREHGRRFGTDYARDLTAQTHGRFDAGAGRVMDQHWRPGGAGADTIRAFKAAFTDPTTGAIDPAALRALRGHIASEIGKFFDPETGQVSKATLTKYLSTHRAAIRELPADLQDQLRTVERASAFAERQGGGKATSRAVANGNAAALFIGRNAQEAIRQALNSDNSVALIRDLHQRVKGSPEALAGLKRAFLDEFANKFTTNMPALGEEMGQSASAARRFWRLHAASARTIFTPAELRQIERVNDNFLSGSQWSSVNRAPGSPTAQYLSNGQLLAAMLQGSPLPGPMRALAEHVMAAVGRVPGLKGGLAAASEKSMAALYEAALNPEVAADLLRRADPAVLDRILGRLDFGGVAARGVPAMSVESSGNRGIAP